MDFKVCDSSNELAARFRPERALFFRLGRRQPPLSQQIRARAFQPSVTMPQFFGIEIPKGEVRFRPVFPRVQSRFPRPRPRAHAEISPQSPPPPMRAVEEFAADDGDSIVLCQAALGLKPKNGERVTVFIKTEDSPELAIGSLTMGSCDHSASAPA